MEECLDPILAFKTGRLTAKGKEQFYLDLAHTAVNYELPIKFYMKLDYDAFNPVICRHDDLQHLDYLTKYVKVPCGKCIACQCNKAIDLATRLYLESTLHKFYYFVTLTYSPEYYSKDRDFKRDFQKFMKRLRKKLGSDNPVRFFSTFEHGETFGRGHFHAIIYFDKPIEDNLIFYKMNGKNILYVSSLMSSLWSYGYNTVGVSQDSIAALCYVSKYCVKKAGFDDDGFYLFSRRPGLGAGAISDIEDNFILVNDGKTVSKRRLPRYVYDKLENQKPALYEAIKALKRDFINEAYNFPKPESDKILNQSFVRGEKLKQFLIDKFSKIS